MRRDFARTENQGIGGSALRVDHEPVIGRELRVCGELDIWFSANARDDDIRGDDPSLDPDQDFRAVATDRLHIGRRLDVDAFVAMPAFDPLAYQWRHPACEKAR